MHFISIIPVLSDHLSYVTIFQYSHGRSYKTGLAEHCFLEKELETINYWNKKYDWKAFQ